MPSISLKNAKFEIHDLILERDDSLPSEMRIRLRVKYDNAILKKDEEEIKMSSDRGLGVYIIYSKGGYLEFKNPVSQKSIKIKCEVRGVWHNDVKDLEIISYPLSYEDIHALEQIDGDRLQIYWSIDCWGFLEKPMNYGLESGNPVSIYVRADRIFELSRLDLIRRILEPADLLKRRFIEVIVEPINTDELDRIPDGDVREALRLLLNKQSHLQDALDRLDRANRSSDYRSVIEDVRDVVEGLTLGTPEGARLFSALEKAFKGLGVIEADPSALDEAVKELLDTIKDISKGAFGYSSIFKHTTTATSKFHYHPKPYKHDAEFAVLQAMIFLDYLIRVLKMYAQRL